MIPRTIHWIWLSKNPQDEVCTACIASWAQVMPGCRIRRWTLEDFDLDTLPRWVREAVSVRKWAFAADYLRLLVLYREGGWYLDADVLLRYPLDEYAGHAFVSAVEVYSGLEGKETIQSAVMGSEAGHPFLRRALDWYESHPFIRPDGSFEMDEIGPQILARLAEDDGFERHEGPQNLRNDMLLMPSWCFAADFGHARAESPLVHLCSGSWRGMTRAEQRIHRYDLLRQIRLLTGEWAGSAVTVGRRRKVAILLPCTCGSVTGGVKIVLDYANALARADFDVSVVQPAVALTAGLAWRRKLHALARYMCYLVLRSARYPRWHEVDRRVRILWVPTLSFRFVPKADLYVATGAETAERMSVYPTDAVLLHFIQGHEIWLDGGVNLSAIYHYPLLRVAVSRGLANLVEKASGFPCAVIPNGTDTMAFGCDVPPAARGDRRVAVMYSRDRWKGFDVALAALELVRERDQDVVVDVFGVRRPDRPLPEGFAFHLNPSRAELRKIYNSASVYVAASRSEGWGLTVAEAMTCGAAVCCTDCVGYLEMAKDGETALVSPVDDARALAANVCRLLSEPELRIRLAANAGLFVRRFDATQSEAAFVEFCKEALMGKTKEKERSLPRRAYLIERDAIGGGMEYIRRKGALDERAGRLWRVFFSSRGECRARVINAWGAGEIVINHFRALFQLFCNSFQRPKGRVTFVVHGIHLRKYDWMILEKVRGMGNALPVLYLKRFVRRALESWLYHCCDRIVALTPTDRDDILRLYGQDLNVEIEPNTLDGWTPNLAKELPAGIRGPFEYLCIGRFDYQKGQDRLIRAVGHIPHPLDTSLIPRTLFIGDGPMRAECEKLAADLGVADRCVFAGAIPDADRYLKCAEVVVSPSRWEGMPYLMMKARALGCRILATDCPGNRDVLEGYEKWEKLEL